MPTTLGNFGLLSCRANDSAVLVDRVRHLSLSNLLEQLMDSGLIIIGKTNLSVRIEFAPANIVHKF